MQKKKSITSYINEEYKKYSKYVCYHRAIPSMIDGFKPSQRKAFYILKNKTKFIKVMAVSGEMISRANYNHGDTSASDAVSKMAQDFTGSNNIPPFLGDGSFGSKFIKQPSAARYIYVKPNEKFYSLFMDFEICETDEDIENPEPKFFLPIIPTLLLNGIEGIAVGFACKILPYKIEDIIKNIRNILNKEEQNIMVPYYKGYKGDTLYNAEENKFIQYGKYEIINTTTIRVTEIPISYDREKYLKFLDKLESKNLIHSYNDSETRTDWNILIKLPRKSKVFLDPMKELGLINNLNENITLIDENGQLVVFNNVNEIMEHFVHYRLSIYKKRRLHMMNKIKEENALIRSKSKFIIDINKFNYKKDKKDKIASYYRKFDFITEEHLEKCFQMPITNLNKEYLLKMRERVEVLKKEYGYFYNITAKELYLSDLKLTEEKEFI